jgi:predicted heme/steroid binding protein
MARQLTSFTAEEVAKHNQEGDAWVVVDGAVFDVSRFAALHPGGEGLLLEFAGGDISENFWGLHRREVLDKFRPRLLVGYIEGVQPPATDSDGLTDWGRISKVPYAESFAWRGLHSPYGVTDQHRAWRTYAREFFDKEVRQIAIDSENDDTPCTLELMQKLSQAGVLHTLMGPGEHLRLLPMPCGIKVEEYSYLHEKILQEEVARLQTPGFIDSCFAGFTISVPPIFNYGTEAMKTDLLPELLAGRKRSALAITEAFCGSDVAGLRTKAVKSECGQFYIVNGTKKWITGGTFVDFFVTAVRTGGAGASGISMMLIPRMEGVETKLIKTAYSR